MSHIRTQIRDAAASILANLATSGANVFESRPIGKPMPNNVTRALYIWTDGEPAPGDQQVGYPMRLERRVRLRIAPALVLNDGFDDELDKMFKEVEAALFASAATFTLNGKARGGVHPAGIADPEFDARGERTVGYAAMFFEAEYYANSNDPETPL